MSSSLAMGRVTCTNPGCLLKKTGVTARDLIGLFVRVLAGEPLENIVPGSQRSSARPKCASCARRVIAGGKACLTEAEWGRLDDLGCWHQRRCRRRNRLSYLH